MAADTTPDRLVIEPIPFISSGRLVLSAKPTVKTSGKVIPCPEGVCTVIWRAHDGAPRDIYILTDAAPLGLLRQTDPPGRREVVRCNADMVSMLPHKHMLRGYEYDEILPVIMRTGLATYIDGYAMYIFEPSDITVTQLTAGADQVGLHIGVRTLKELKK